MACIRILFESMWDITIEGPLRLFEIFDCISVPPRESPDPKAGCISNALPIIPQLYPVNTAPLFDTLPVLSGSSPAARYSRQRGQ